MIFSKAAVSTLLLAGSAAAFAPQATPAFVPAKSTTAAFVPVTHASSHVSGCSCSSCRSSKLFSDATAAAEAVEEVPAEVEAMDGIESEEEAHNADRPARKAIRKKGPRGKPLNEFTVGDTVQAKVKTITSYGAFLDIGATTDGLLHISQLSVGFVSDVNEVLKVGQEIDVRITNIDEGKGQVALSLLTQDEEEASKEAASRPRQPQRSSGGNRRDDSAVLSQLVEKGWNSDQFVEGTVVSTVDFGAFVRVDASQLQEGVEGEFDGLVHISALTSGRASSVTSVVSVDDKVQVRVKAIADRKVSLSMVSPEDEAAKMEMSGNAPPQEGAADWKESLAKLQDSMPEFKNKPLVVDMRK